MKKCNIPYCKEIPNDWQEIPNKYLFDYRSVKVGEQWKNYQLLSLTTSGVKEKDINASGGKVPDSYDKYQTVDPGDMIFCLFDLDVSAVFSGLSNYHGMITSAYDVVRPNQDLLVQGFSNYWFQYVFSNRYYKMYSKNIRYTITSEMFKAISTPIPPILTQQKIASFLDKKCGEIDSLVDIETKQIEKLKEYKGAVITEAVTKGLDSSTPMKDSGISWLGQIPESWEVCKIKHLLEINGRIGFRGYTQNDLRQQGEGAITLSPSNVKDLRMDYNKCSYVSWEKYNESPEIQVKINDIIFVKTGSSFGKSSIVDTLPLEATINPQLVILKNIKVNPMFILYSINSYTIRYQVDVSVVGGTIPTISQEKINNYLITLPPLTVQQQIADYLDQKCADIDRLIEIKQKKIEKLNEYKKSLIYEYVTGKKQVI